MDAKQAKFVSQHAWVFKHSDFNNLRPIIQESPLAIALSVWENIGEDGSTIQELSQRLDLNPNTVATTTRSLEQAGLVRRSKNPLNRRETLVERE